MSYKKKALLEDIKLKKRHILVMNLKVSAGELLAFKDIIVAKKEVARLFTKLNDVKYESKS